MRIHSFISTTALRSPPYSLLSYVELIIRSDNCTSQSYLYQPHIFIGDVTEWHMIHLVGSYEYLIPTEPILPCVDSMIVSRYPLTPQR